MKKVGYIGNFYKIPEYILHSPFSLDYVIVENDCLSDEMLTFLKVRNIPYVELEEKNDLLKVIRDRKVDFWITCSYGKRIPIEEMRDVHIYNIHYAALPNYKGRHPTFYATINDEKKIGISIHKVTKKLDEGEIIAQEFVPYYLWENENDLFEKLTKMVPSLLVSLDSYMEGHLSVITKNSSGNYYPPVSKDDYTIDINNDSPATIFNKVRAQSKYKGAFLLYNGEEHWINRVFFSSKEHFGKLCIKRDGYYIVME